MSTTTGSKRPRGRIGCQGFGIKFRIAAAKVERMQIFREMRAGERAELNQVCALSSQFFQSSLVIETERAIAGDSDAHRSVNRWLARAGTISWQGNRARLKHLIKHSGRLDEAGKQVSFSLCP